MILQHTQLLAIAVKKSSCTSEPNQKLTRSETHCGVEEKNEKEPIRPACSEKFAAVELISKTIASIFVCTHAEKGKERNWEQKQKLLWLLNRTKEI